MANPPSAAKPDLASALWPSLSREAKMKEAQKARAQAEQKAHNKRMADHLKTLTEQLRRERGAD
jgi:hypothetical protein